MKMRIILLFANAYQMAADDGRVIEGVTCNYYFNTSLEAVNNVNGSVGTRPAKGNMPYETFLKVKKAPAIYDADFEMTVDKEGKPILKIIDVDYVGDVRFVLSSSSEDAAGTAAPSAAAPSAAAPAAASSDTGAGPSTTGTKKAG